MTNSHRAVWFQLAFRMTGGAVLIYLAYPETGPWTTAVLALMLIGIEGNALVGRFAFDALASIIRRKL